MSWTKKAYCTYLLSNRKNGTIYVGISGNLSKRMLEHKNGTNEGFTKKYGLNKLVYYESFEVVENAIKREKQLKGGKRSTKVQLIEKDNPKWDDLSADWWG
jgi:putative endonuclease